MYDSENALSHRNSTYSIGIPYVWKLKPLLQQHKLKLKNAKIMQIQNRHLFTLFTKSFMFLPHRLH